MRAKNQLRCCTQNFRIRVCCRHKHEVEGKQGNQCRNGQEHIGKNFTSVYFLSCCFH